ncbi:MAG: hypothetical protein AB8I08_06060 [Sandaracinaceae bacterium]
MFFRPASLRTPTRARTPSAALLLGSVLCALPGLAHAQTPEPATESEAFETPDPFEEAESRAALFDLEGAAARYEQYAAACLADSTPDGVCDRTDRALENAFRLRRVLGQRDAADRAARDHVMHFLYARPRASLRLGLARVNMHLDAEDPGRAEEALEALTTMLPDPPPAQGIVTDALRARIASLSGHPRRAAMHWRRVERRFSRTAEVIDPDGPVPMAWVNEAVAEGRLVRAQSAVTRYLATRPPRARRVADPERWWQTTMSPWLVRQRRRLLMARMELERVYELGSPRHSVMAVARIGELYGHQAALHQALDLPENDWVRTLVHEGLDRPGYDQARSHYQTCVRWSAHHEVASEWSLRCQAALRDLDPEEHPAALELHGTASYLPVSDAPAPSVR